MSCEYPDPGERDELHAEDLYVADLLGDYIHRQEHHQPPRLPELLARAAQFSPDAARKLATVAAFYDTARTTGRA